MPGTSVSEVHRYPLRPEGFEEPLFPTRESRRVAAEHLLGAPWLSRASEVAEPGRGGETAHRYGEPVELERVRGSVEVVLPRTGGRRCRKGNTGRPVVEILDRWREVRGWWGEDGTDRVVFRVLLAGGMVADLARDRTSSWYLVGVAD